MGGQRELGEASTLARHLTSWNLSSWKLTLVRVANKALTRKSSTCQGGGEEEGRSGGSPVTHGSFELLKDACVRRRAHLLAGDALLAGEVGQKGEALDGVDQQILQAGNWERGGGM